MIRLTYPEAEIAGSRHARWARWALPLLALTHIAMAVLFWHRAEGLVVWQSGLNFLLAAWWMAMTVMLGRPGVRIDPAGLVVKGPLSTETLSWDDLDAIEIDWTARGGWAPEVLRVRQYGAAARPLPPEAVGDLGGPRRADEREWFEKVLRVYADRHGFIVRITPPVG